MANTKRVEDGIPITVWLDKETVKLIDDLSRKADMSRSRLVRNLIKVGADELKTMDSFGLISLMRLVETATGGVRGIIRKWLGSEAGDKDLSNKSEE
ncbi:MAG: ribbon-helix-helix protein, CopG family [Syntrophobacteraceae bacterium]|jgi:hypothetical protein